MKFSGRRQKRFFLLKREKLEFIGGVELTLPDRLIGWVIAEANILDEVRLYLGNHLITKAPINLKREDVHKIHNLRLNCGFELILPDNIPDEIKVLKAKVVAINFLNNKSYKLKLLQKKSNIELNISEILKINLLGSIGHFDGLIDNKLQGWASKKRSQEKINIWMQCPGKIPKEVKCDKYRSDLKKDVKTNNCGFAIDIQSIPEDWFRKEIFFSFDYSGLIRLPQLGYTILNKKYNPINKKDSKLIKNKENSISLNKKNELSSTLPKLSQIEQSNDLENISLTLTRLENIIDNLEANAIKQNKDFYLINKIKSYFKRFISILRNINY